jgi:hypothetical protein
MTSSLSSFEEKGTRQQQHDTAQQHLQFTGGSSNPGPRQSSHLNDPDPEKLFSRLTPVPSSTSTIEEAIDAEAGFANVPLPQAATTTKSNDDDPGPPPNGGFHAWLQVAGSFFLFFNCW